MLQILLSSPGALPNPSFAQALTRGLSGAFPVGMPLAQSLSGGTPSCC